jgi:hypothetical protein
MKKIHNACVVCCFTNFQTQEPNTKLNLDYLKINKLSSTSENLENINKNFFEKNLNKKQYKMECEVEWGDLSLWGRSLCKDNDCEMLP